MWVAPHFAATLTCRRTAARLSATSTAPTTRIGTSSFQGSDRDAQRVRFLCVDALFLLRVFVTKTCILADANENLICTTNFKGVRASASKREVLPTEFSAPCVCLWRVSPRNALALSKTNKNALMWHARPTNDNPTKIQHRRSANSAKNTNARNPLFGRTNYFSKKFSDLKNTETSNDNSLAHCGKPESASNRANKLPCTHRKQSDTM